MPGVDGFDLAERLRADARFARLPIVFLTSAGQTGDLQRCEQLAIAARLVKPVKQSELFRVMARVAGVERGAEPEDAVRRVVREPAVAAPASLAPLRILLVDDSTANRKVALAMLGRSHRIETAENGRIALEKLEQAEFDVVLMDVQMPEMDGYEATAEIRKREARSGGHLHVIAMTAHALQGDREKCLAAGMDDYVAKPVRRDRLFAALARVTRG
jgi:CheY-like chemotaxis protein